MQHSHHWAAPYNCYSIYWFLLVFLAFKWEIYPKNGNVHGKTNLFLKTLLFPSDRNMGKSVSVWHRNSYADGQYDKNRFL